MQHRSAFGLFKGVHFNVLNKGDKVWNKKNFKWKNLKTFFYVEIKVSFGSLEKVKIVKLSNRELKIITFS